VVAAAIAPILELALLDPRPAAAPSRYALQERASDTKDA
jgi:hypothetical protein